MSDVTSDTAAQADVPAEAMPTTNAEAFAQLQAPTDSQAHNEPPAQIAETATVAESPPDVALVHDAATTPPVVDFDALAPRISELVAQMLKAHSPAPAAPEPPAAPPATPTERTPWELFAQSQLGDDAEYVSGPLIGQLANTHEQIAVWTSYAKTVTSDADRAKAARNLATLQANLSTLERQAKSAAHQHSSSAEIAALKEKLAKLESRGPARPTKEIHAEYVEGVTAHVTANAKQFPSLSAAINGGRLSAAKLLEGVDLQGAQGDVDRAVLERINMFEQAAAALSATAAEPPKSPPPAKPVANPGIFAPGTTPAAAAPAPFPKTNADVWATLASKMPRPN